MDYPESLQTLIIKGCVLSSKVGWTAANFQNLKRFAIQDSIVNWRALLHRPFNPDKLEDYILIDT